MRKISICLICVYSLTCFQSFCEENHNKDTYVNSVLGELRSEAQIIIELAESSMKAGKNHWRGREATKDVDQLIYRNVTKIANSKLIALPKHKIDYGTVFTPNKFDRSSIDKSSFDIVQQTRKKEFIDLCKKISKARPYLSLQLASHLCRLAEQDDKYNFQDAWSLVENWLSWSLRQTHEDSYSIHLDGYKDLYYLGTHPMDKRYFIAYVGSKAEQKDKLIKYIEQYRKTIPAKDKSKEFAMMLFAKSVELYCSESKDIPKITVNTYAESFKKQYRFNSSDLITLFKYKNYSTNVQLKTAKRMAKIQHPSEEFYLYLINEFLSKKESEAIEQLMVIICNKDQNVRLTVLREILINYKNKKIYAALKNHHHQLILAALDLGKDCLSKYPIDKPHHFCRNFELEKLFKMGNQVNCKKTQLQIRQKVITNYLNCQKKFKNKKWYKESSMLEKFVKQSSNTN